MMSERLCFCLRVVKTLPTHKMSAICELLPHHWQPRQAVVIA
jgi:hypothetical protein